jgi:hypothetical protein
MSTIRRLSSAPPPVRRSESGQALVMALAALAVGALLVAPFLAHVSVSVLASRQADQATNDYYAVDAGIEWGLWHLQNDPLLTASTVYTDVPLQPTPAAINGAAFPTVEVRYVAGAGAVHTTSPAWLGGAGVQCYAVESSEDGDLFALIDSPATTVEGAIRTSCDGTGLPVLGNGPPYQVQELAAPAGTYQLVVRTSPASTGSVSITFPAASYDLRAERAGHTVTVRASASTNGVEVISWQHD